MFDIVVAVSQKDGIGYLGQLPWPHLSEDMKHFYKITTMKDKPNAVIMGRKTWDSLPDKVKPLPKRDNFILSNNKQFVAKNATGVFHDFDTLIEYTAKYYDNIFVIGGAQIFKIAMSHPGLRHIYVTRINQYFPVDTYFTHINSWQFHLMEQSEKQQDPKHGILYCFERWQKINQSERSYLDLLLRIMTNGEPRPDRTGIGTLSLFAKRLCFDIRYTFPLLTTKRTFWRGIVGELLWFIKGSTDANELKQQNIHIWDGNSTRAFLDSRGLTDYKEGQLGPVYGAQWRRFGPTNIDQLSQVIKQIKEDPWSRRHIVTAWNPTDIPKMALPPCHMCFQFYVHPHPETGEPYQLSCRMIQRSADMFLGVPFNIGSYALLTLMVAHVCGLKPRELIMEFGDTHIYRNHLDQCTEQIKRQPYCFPTVRLNSGIHNIDDFTVDDIRLVNYKCHPRIKANMAI